MHLSTKASATVVYAYVYPYVDSYVYFYVHMCTLMFLLICTCEYTNMYI